MRTLPLALLLAGSVQAQTILETEQGHTNALDITGESLDIQGDVVVMGAPGLGAGDGRVDLYSASTGELEALLFPPPATTPGEFGRSVAMRGQQLLAGDVGMVHLYTLPNSNPTVTFLGPTHEFGRRVALENGRVFVADAGADSPVGNGTGAVFQYDLLGNLQSAWVPSTAPAGGDFGFSIAAQGDLLVGSNSGSHQVHVFDVVTGAEVRMQRPTPISPSQQFGRQVTIEGALVSVSSPGFNGVGAVFVFDVATGTLIRQIDPPAGVTFFGNAIAQEGGELFVAHGSTVSVYEPVTGLHLRDLTTPSDISGLAASTHALVASDPTDGHAGNNLAGIGYVMGRGEIGTPYCSPAVANSTGVPGELIISGSPSNAKNVVTLAAVNLPPSEVVIFFNGPSQAFLPNAGGSQGNLCVGGPYGRFDFQGTLGRSGASGALFMPIDMNAFPRGTGTIATQPGETWNFQAYYRDGNDTNFTSATTSFRET